MTQNALIGEGIGKDIGSLIKRSATLHTRTRCEEPWTLLLEEHAWVLARETGGIQPERPSNGVALRHMQVVGWRVHADASLEHEQHAVMSLARERVVSTFLRG
jgi:hypothetical protein